MQTGLSLLQAHFVHFVTPGSWLGKEKKEDKGVTSLHPPLRQQEKENGFQINVNTLF